MKYTLEKMNKENNTVKKWKMELFLKIDCFTWRLEFCTPSNNSNWNLFLKMPMSNNTLWDVELRIHSQTTTWDLEIITYANGLIKNTRKFKCIAQPVNNNPWANDWEQPEWDYLRQYKTSEY